MFVEGKSRTVFFPSETLMYGISRDGSKNYNIRTCEHMILGQLRMGARQTNYAPLVFLLFACNGSFQPAPPYSEQDLPATKNWKLFVPTSAT